MKRVPKVVFSSINFGMSPHALRSPSWLGDFAKSAGFDGVEYMPMFDRLPGHTPQAIGKAVMSRQLELTSLHTSFRETGNSRYTNKTEGNPNADRLIERVLASSLGRLIMPEVCESASVMAAIQAAANKTVPVTLYPQARKFYDYPQIIAARGSEHLFQPTDNVAQQIGATSIEAFDADMRGLRKYGYVLDTFHWRRTYGAEQPGVISDMAVSVPYLAPHTRAIHLSLNRGDIKGEGHIPTLDEAKQALQGEYTGGLRDMLDEVKAHGDVQYAVVELTTGGLAEAMGHSGLHDLRQGYADIAQGFREYWQTP